MYQLHPANRRGRTYTGWLDSYHTFSFGSYHDPRYMNFGSLRVINDDIVAPGAGFDMHPHDNMEIVSIVLRGKLQHRDNLGNGDVLKPGDVQKMTAGSGIIHSEFNPSDKEPVHFLQIWIIPNMLDLRPSYEQKAFNRKSMTNRLTLLVSPDGHNGSLEIHQDAEIWQILLEDNKDTEFAINHSRKIWIQIAEGSVSTNEHLLVAGDGLAVSDEEGIIRLRGIDKLSNIIIFNLRA